MSEPAREITGSTGLLSRLGDSCGIPARLSSLLTCAAVFGTLCPLLCAVTWPRFMADRFRGTEVQVRDVQGVQERVHDGKLYLRVKDFVALVLKNNTEINLTRLDLLNAADAVLCQLDVLRIG